MSSQDLFAPSSETRRLSVQLAPEDLKNIGMQDDEVKEFLKLRERYLKKPFVDWPKVSCPEADFFRSFESLKDVSKEKATELLKKLIVVELNGGLGNLFLNFKHIRLYFIVTYYCHQK
jgi:UDP-N-acetylglucosamine pyrophosphorylase